MNGPVGAPALLPALMGPCKEPGNVMAHHMGALSVGETGWRPSTASSGSVQVRLRQQQLHPKHFDCI